MSKYSKYPNYKDSGVEWLGDIPEGWSYSRLKFLIKTRKGFAFKAESFQESGVAVVKASDIKNGTIEKTTVHLPNNFLISHNKSKLYQGDIVLSTVGSTPDVTNSAVGQIGVVPASHNESLLNQNTVVFTSSTRHVSNQFLSYLLKTTVYREHLDIHAHGTANQASLSIVDMLDFISVLPIFKEQKSIANYLDKATTKIDTLIEKQTKLIELLKEKRQAVISSAVTRGLDASVPMKESGVEWLGEIPEHWKVKRIKFITNKMKAGPFGSALKKDSYTKNGYKIYGQEQVIANNFKHGDYYISSDKFKEMKQYEISHNDILISCVGTFGKIALVPLDAKQGIINPRLVMIRLDSKCYPQYIEWYLRSINIFEQMVIFGRGGTMDIVNIAILSGLQLTITSIQEQISITEYLDKTTSKIDNLITKSTQAIGLLKEKRTALISAAVTGKIDVRDAA